MTMTRRNALTLTGAGLSTVLGGTAAAAVLYQSRGTDTPSGDAALLAANDRLQAIRAELAEARADMEWIAAEWRHLWPLAPEEILSGANAHIHGGTRGTIERDIIGAPIMRDKAPLTKRLSREFRAEGGQTCFLLDTAAKLSDRLAWLCENKPEGRTAASLARNVVRRERVIRDLEKRIALAREYEATTAGLRAAANVQPTIDRIAALRAAELAALADLMGHEPATHAGVALKASALLASPEWDRFPFRDQIASDVRRIAKAGA